MNKPITTNPVADLPENWEADQIVSPIGTDVGLSEAHGYNHLNGKVNEALEDIGTLNDAFVNVQPNSEKAQPNGIASLDANGKVPTSQIPVVPVANGGTGRSSVTQNSFLVGNGVNAMVEKSVSQMHALLGVGRPQYAILVGSGTWVAPADLVGGKVRVFAVGGGGGGNSVLIGGNPRAVGGGSGDYAFVEIDVDPEESVSYAVGAGGTTGNAGSVTSFGVIDVDGGGAAESDGTGGSGAAGGGGSPGGDAMYFGGGGGMWYAGSAGGKGGAYGGGGGAYGAAPGGSGGEYGGNGGGVTGGSSTAAQAGTTGRPILMLDLAQFVPMATQIRHTASPGSNETGGGKTAYGGGGGYNGNGANGNTGSVYPTGGGGGGGYYASAQYTGGAGFYCDAAGIGAAGYFAENFGGGGAGSDAGKDGVIIVMYLVEV